MIWHTVQQGECISSIAKLYRIADPSKIYSHPDNAALRQKRADPNLLFPGDEVAIPFETRQENRAIDSKHRFRVGAQPTMLRLIILNEDGQPVADKNYSLSVDGQQVEGRTRPNGLIEHEIAADAQRGELRVQLDDPAYGTVYTWSLQIGFLDPIDELSGVQARLNNLGFDSGEVDGLNGPRTRAAVKSFQKKHGLVVDGIAGPKTKAQLKRVYGC
jgi:N-acetylmuramoyl-L-alanine amidase